MGGSATSGPAPGDGPDAGRWRVLAHLPARAVGSESPPEPDGSRGLEPRAAGSSPSSLSSPAPLSDLPTRDGFARDRTGRDRTGRDAATTSHSTNQEVTP